MQLINVGLPDEGLGGGTNPVLPTKGGNRASGRREPPGRYSVLLGPGAGSKLRAKLLAGTITGN
jgi:hypothetical protein